MKLSSNTYHISGVTSSDKTFNLKILSSSIPDNERIVIIEDASELQFNQPHSRPSNVEGKGTITLRDLVRDSLRMTPNRIVIGEVRGKEVLDMLIGHDGSQITLEKKKL